MGYYTQFDIEDNPTDVVQAITEASGYGCLRHDVVKWYRWKEDVASVSKRFPDKLIKISGEGEEAGDIWKAYFKNGKYQYTKAELRFEDYDESKLKNI
jgi:hypothetical protein